jgi:hypothetical protein
MADHCASNRRITRLGAPVLPDDAVRLMDILPPPPLVVVPTAIDYTATPNQCVEVTGAGGVTIWLPAMPAAGANVKIKNRSAGLVTVDGNGHTIDGAPSQPLPMLYDQLTVTMGTVEWMIE